MPKKRISTGMLVLLIQVSVLIDIGQFLLDLIPGFGWAINVAIDFCVSWIFWLWLKALGVNFKKKSVMAAFIGGIVLDIIPFASVLAWTADILLIYKITSREDKRRIAAAQAQAATQNMLK